MPPIEFPQLPFLTREMLRKGNQMAFSLRITVAGDNTDPLQIRGFTRNSVINQVIRPVSDGSNVSVRIGIDDIPIMVGIFDTDDLQISGSCWASITLEIDNVRVAELCSGFVSREKSISWPATNSKDPVPNRGLITTIASADPAAAANISITVPAGQLWLIHFGMVDLTTDGTGANRRVHFRFRNSDGVAIETFSSVDQTASQVRRYALAKYGAIQDEFNDEDYLINIPADLWIDALGTITTEVKNFQAGDDFGVMRFVVEQFFDRNV